MILRSILLPLALGAALASRAAGSVDPEAETEAPAALQEAAADAFTPYEAIIDRAIFGRPPARPVAPPPPPTDALDQKQAEALAKKITLCAINRTPSGNIAVGLIDNDAKPPRNIYLNVGDTADGYTILAADYDAETATIEKDGITITLKLGKGLVGTGAPEGAAVASALAAAPPRNASKRTAEPTAEPEQPKHEPALKTSTEQLLSMVLSVPPGVDVPPLPIAEGDDLAQDSANALASTIVIEEDDSDATAVHKENVGWAKVEMREHLEQEGGTAVSYIKRLEERRKEEAARQQAARAEAEAKIVELAKELSAQELEKQREAINQWLIDNDVAPLEDEDYDE